MSRNRTGSIRNTRTIAILGFMVALTIVLTRIAKIEIGPAVRLSFGNACTILTGLWFGPVAAGIAGAVADLVGFVFQPSYTLMPLITLSAAMWGIIPGLLSGFVRGKRTRKVVGVCLIVVVTSVVCQLGLTTLGLSQMLGVSFAALLPTRLIQFLGSTPAYCAVVSMLYLSPVTAMVQETPVKGGNSMPTAVR